MIQEGPAVKDSHTIQMTFENNVITLIVIDSESEQRYFAEVKGDRLPKQLDLLFNNVEDVYSYLKKQFAKGTLKITLDNHIQIPLISKPLVLKTETFEVSQLESLRSRINKLQAQRSEDVKTILKLQQKTKELDYLKHVITRMQEDFKLYYFQPFVFKKLIFVEDPTIPYRVKGNYLSIDKQFAKKQFGMGIGRGRGSGELGNNRVISIEAINQYPQPAFSFQITFENNASTQTKIGLCTVNKLLTTSITFNNNLPTIGRGDVLTMTIDKQKQSVTWYYNKKVIGRQICNLDDSEKIYPYVQLFDASRQASTEVRF